MSRSIREYTMRWTLFVGIGSAAAALLPLVAWALFHVPSGLTSALGLALAAAFTAFALGTVLLNRFTAKVAEMACTMTVSAHEISRGDLNRTVDTTTLPVEELRALGDEINATATRARSDITEMKRLERVRSEFLGNVSHELRTPIFSVQGYLETLIDGAVDDHAVRDDFLQKAHQNVLRLHTLLTDLIEISRIESGEMKMSFRYFDALEYLRGIVHELSPTAEIAGVNLAFNVLGSNREELLVLGDRDRLKQAVVNLVENAIKYNHRDGHVTLELEVHDSEALVRVRDDGIGIPQEDIRRIFERFYRVNKDRSRAVGGSGLGLAIVKHIIEAHGTSVVVDSELGKGSTFSFALKR
ncbi:MAG: ATP-binding protein [Bacteroidetes bacterium]|nr:ATP-binding protein [Bacteroidota bacterium]